MDAVVDFLLEYYVWILVVLVILLITVIGFLADTKRKKKKRESTDNVQTNVNQNVGGFDPNMNDNMFNQNLNNMNNFNVDMNNGMNMMNTFDNNFNNMNNMLNQDLNNINNQNVNGFVPNMGEVNNFNSINNSVPSQNFNNQNLMVDNVMNGGNDVYFQSTSEQTPTFAPREVVIPKPVEGVSIMNMGSTPSPVIEPVPVSQPVMEQNVNNVSPVVSSSVNNDLNTNLNVEAKTMTNGQNVNVIPSMPMQGEVSSVNPEVLVNNINSYPQQGTVYAQNTSINGSVPNVIPNETITQVNANAQILPNTNFVSNNNGINTFATTPTLGPSVNPVTNAVPNFDSVYNQNLNTQQMGMQTPINNSDVQNIIPSNVDTNNQMQVNNDNWKL